MATTALTDVITEAGSAETTLEFPDNRLMLQLCGELDSNLKKIVTATGVEITHRGNRLSLFGDDEQRKHSATILRAIYSRLEQRRPLEPGDVDAAIRMPSEVFDAPRDSDQIEMFKRDAVEIRTRKRIVEPRTPMQRAYVKSLFDHELVFGLGPAGTGKTYLAVAAAVSHYIDGHVDRIILSRPAVEAGERLGFLPGDLKEKVDPYMQPLYDALNAFLPAKQVQRMIEDKQIEIAPLAFMRGRTLSNAFVILDEAQNATAMQMKMFLTRMGSNSRIAVTGDTTQIDLPTHLNSGLIDAISRLSRINGIGMINMTESDIVRHRLVREVVKAYEQKPKSRKSR